MVDHGKVAICVRTYERPEFLRRTIAGVIAQTYENWVLSIFNNGGDAARLDAVVDEFAEQLRGRFNVIHSEKRVDIARAASESAAAVESDFVVVHDDDDDWEPGFLATTTARLAVLDERYVGVSTRAIWVVEQQTEDGGWEIAELNEAVYENLNVITIESAIEQCPVPPICLLIRRSAWDAIGGYSLEVGFSSDWHAMLKLLALGEIDVVPLPLARYHWRANHSGTQANLSREAGGHPYSDQLMRERLLRDPFPQAELDLTPLIASISNLDRETHALMTEAIDHLRTIRIDADATRHRLAHLEDRVDQLDPTRRRFWRTLWLRLRRRVG